MNFYLRFTIHDLLDVGDFFNSRNDLIDRIAGYFVGEAETLRHEVHPAHGRHHQ